MARSVDEDTEYESDPEEAKRALTMRRREASDDEEEEETEGDERDRPVSWIGSRSGIGSAEDSDGQGAPADYDEEESEIEDDEEELEDNELEYGEVEEYEVGETKDGEKLEGGAVRVVERELRVEGDGSVGKLREIEGLNHVEEGKKEIEPFAVPTAGAFYMHDDRFRGSNGGRNRKMLGGRRLWESKDDKKWGHDKFEEITLQERHYEEGGRNSRGRFRGRGKNRGPDSGYPRGNKSKGYSNNSQNLGPKDVRGRGPRRYEPSKEAYPTQEKRSGKVTGQTSYTTSGKTLASISTLEYDPVPPARKQVVASSLNSASPPFYPSGSSNKEIASMQKRDAHAGTINRDTRSSVLNENVSVSQPNSMMRGKNVADLIGMERLYINGSIPQNAGKPSITQMLPPGPSFVSATRPLQARSQGKVLAPSVHTYFQPGAPLGQVNRASPPPQVHSLQQSPAQNRTQPFLLAQQFEQSLRNGSQDSRPPKSVLTLNSSEPGEMISLPESSKSKTLVGKGNTTVQGSGRGSILYGGAQVMGATSVGSGCGDQNFAATPAFLPVMPFSGQHPGGIGVPAVGMAFPGYVAQTQLGLGSREMTWLPVVAGPAGALGATYGSPYIAFDGAFHSRPPGQTSTSGVPSEGNNANKPINEWKPSQRNEITNDETGQKQKNIRRYTEMNFGR